MDVKGFDNYYSSKDVNDQIQFILYQTGTGYDYVAKMLDALNRDRNHMLGILQEIAGGDGNINLTEICDFVEEYEKLTTRFDY